MSKTFQFASIWKRILAGLGDYLTIAIISFSSMFLFLINIDINRIFNDHNYLIDGYRFFGYCVLNFILYLVYFCLIPYCCHGYTLWTRILNIKMVDKENKRLKFSQILKHNMTLWVSMSICMIFISVLYWVFSSLNLGSQFISGLLSFSNKNANTSVGYIFGVIGKVIMIVIGIINSIFLINIIFNRSTYSLIDIFSDTYMIYNKELSIEKNNKPKTFNSITDTTILPGMIAEDELEN